MRKPHQLTKNKGIRLPDNVIYFDSESRVDPDSLIHNPYLIVGCFCRYKRKYEQWRTYTNKSLVNFWWDVHMFAGLKKRRVFVYAHNAVYDLLVTGGIPAMLEKGYRVTNFYEGGPVFLLTMKNAEHNKTIEFISSTNYYSESLSALGATFDLPKLTFDYAEGSLEESIIYCKRDVEIVKIAIETFRDFITKNNLGNLAKTLAGQAFNTYRHKFMKHDIFIHSNERVLGMERDAYCGGRVECFQVGSFHGDFYCYDVNSMYPFVMKEMTYPRKLVSYRKRCSIEDINQLMEEHLVIARCKVRVPDPRLHCNLSGNLIFPVGEFWNTYTTPEIKFLLSKGWLIEVKEVSIYEHGHIFGDYVDYFYTQRLQAKKEGNKVEDKLFKLLLNSLYGKFGQTGETWEDVGEADPAEVMAFTEIDADTGERINFKIFGGTIFQQKNEKEAFNSFPAVAAHVTAYARMVLLDYMEKAGYENVYYCDTDSLFVNKWGHERLLPFINKTELGKIKLEEHSNSLIINAPKDYKFGSKVKRKGVKKGSQQISENEFMTEVWPHLNSFIREGKLSGYQNIRCLKKLSRIYTKGWVAEDGQVKPFTLKASDEGKNFLQKIMDPDALQNPSQIPYIYKKFTHNIEGWF